MAKNGAPFMYEGKNISSDQAIELLKKNTSLHMEVENSSGKTPVVRISKNSIKIGSLDTPQKPNKLLEYVRELHEKNAILYHNDKRISSSEGLLRFENKNIVR